ncbi:MAG TPA: enoyl-CoA hydratase [Kosmotogaceae bacterium]|nr:MAG: MaoC domain protein dehydratase [Thermotogales bacterium 46_20]HAA85568.1 enoyl-CoA hydratase [Kosmotogaceae bacterium]
MNYSDISSGQTYESERAITDEMVVEFARITGDDNPIHLDEEAARNSMFGRRIAHGMLVMGVVSSVLGREFPGPGTVYMKQEAKFLRPVYINERIRVRVTVLEKIEEKRRLRLSTEVLKEDDQLAVTGEALVLFRKE